MAAMYVIYHGAKVITNIAKRIHLLSKKLATGLTDLGIQQLNNQWFDTLKVNGVNAVKLKSVAEQQEMNFHYFNDGTVGISLDETTSNKDVNKIIEVFAEALGKNTSTKEIDLSTDEFPAEIKRTSTFLLHPVFNSHHSESQMMRNIKF
jgi:glycine dehydrogenase